MAVVVGAPSGAPLEPGSGADLHQLSHAAGDGEPAARDHGHSHAAWQTGPEQITVSKQVRLEEQAVSVLSDLANPGNGDSARGTGLYARDNDEAAVASTSDDAFELGGQQRIGQLTTIVDEQEEICRTWVADRWRVDESSD